MTNVETLALSHKCYRLANVIRRRHFCVLLGLSMAFLPSLFGMFSLAAMMGGLLLGCIYFLDTLLIARGANDDPGLLITAGILITGLLCFLKPDSVSLSEMNMQVVGLALASGCMLCNYFSDVFVAVLETRKQTLKETAISPAK